MVSQKFVNKAKFQTAGPSTPFGRTTGHTLLWMTDVFILQASETS